MYIFTYLGQVNNDEFDLSARVVYTVRPVNTPKNTPAKNSTHMEFGSHNDQEENETEKMETNSESNGNKNQNEHSDIDEENVVPIEQGTVKLS